VRQRELGLSRIHIRTLYELCVHCPGGTMLVETRRQSLQATTAKTLVDLGCNRSRQRRLWFDARAHRGSGNRHCGPPRLGQSIGPKNRCTTGFEPDVALSLCFKQTRSAEFDVGCCKCRLWLAGENDHRLARRSVSLRMGEPPLSEAAPVGEPASRIRSRIGSGKHPHSRVAFH
jgi:hypothetical protein